MASLRDRIIEYVLKMLNEEIELLGRVRMNNLIAGNMYKTGVDDLARAVLSDEGLLAIVWVVP